MPLKEFITRAAAGQHLTRADAARALEIMFTGDAPPVQMAALLVALRMKGETPDEIAGAAEAMRARAERVDPGEGPPVVDTCGTGGDGKGTFNISTAAAFVAAGAGARVAKHGNRAVSSKCGSADVLQALGVNIEAPRDTVERCLREVGIAFLFAPRHHAAMKHVAQVRKELGLRTIFNILGPLANPAGARRQVLGVYDVKLVPVMAETLVRLGAERAFVVYGEGGVDELTPAGSTEVAEVKDGMVRRYRVTPEELGVERCRAEDLLGSDPAANAAALRAVLAGEPGPRRNAVLLTAGAALAAAGIATTPAEGVRMGAEAIASGRAAGKLEALVRATTA
jgi:anthranilate phosphoribosyltransferase